MIQIDWQLVGLVFGAALCLVFVAVFVKSKNDKRNCHYEVVFRSPKTREFVYRRYCPRAEVVEYAKKRFASDETLSFFGIRLEGEEKFFLEERRTVRR